MIAVLIGLAVTLAALAAWEAARGSGGWLRLRFRRLERLEIPGTRNRSLGDLIEALGTRGRLRRAGLEQRLPLQSLLALKIGSALTGLLLGAGLVGFGSPGPKLLLAMLAPAAGFLAPDAVVEVFARRRMRAVQLALGDALEIAANGVAGGRDPLRAILSGASEGSVLAREIEATLAQTGCGVARRVALEDLLERLPTAELGSVVSALDRSARFGSPLADRLRRRAEAMRRTERRRITEGAAKSAPRIQLVVALVLVPSVLLMIAAGLLANLGSMLSGI